MAQQDWVYINVHRETKEKLDTLAAQDKYRTRAGIIAWLVDEEIKRQATFQPYQDGREKAE